jgi:acetyl-CoA acetyltransferase
VPAARDGGDGGLAAAGNASGGLLSKGEPLGASALGQIVELTWQLRGQAEARQVSGARVALAHTVGRGANACVAILTR